MTSVYWVVLAASRIANSNRVDQSGVDDGNVIDWVKTNEIILATLIGTSKGPLARSYRLHWRNVTDSGSFAPVGSTGQVKWAQAVDTVLVDGATLSTPLCSAIPEPTWQDGLENEVDNLLPDSGTFSLADECYTEFQWALSLDDALQGKIYEFELYDVTESTVIGTCGAQITTSVELTYPQSNGRIANASASWQDACDADIINWDKSNHFILSTYATGGSGNNKDFKLRWREGGGVFADVTEFTEIGFNASTVLVDGNSVANPAGCLSSTKSEENEGNNVATLDSMGSSDVGEIQWALNSGGAQDGILYEFQLVCTTDATTAINLCSITTAVGETTAYKDITLKTTLESALTYKDVSLKITLDSLDYKDITLKTSLESAPTYKDISLKTTLESVLTYKDIALKISLIYPPSYKDVALKTTLDSLSYKDIALKTTLESISIYKDIALKTSLNSAPSYKDITLKTSFTSNITYKDITLKTTLDSLDYKDVSLKTTLNFLGYKDVALKTSLELGQILVYKDITLKTSLESALTYKDITLRTSLHNLDYKDITLKTTLDSLVYKDISLKVSLELDVIVDYKDITLKTSITSANTYKDITLKTTLDSLDYKDIVLKTSLDSLDYKDITLKTSLDSNDFKDITLKTSLESALTYKDVVLKTTFDSLTYKDVVLKTTLNYLGFKDVALKISLELEFIDGYKDVGLKVSLDYYQVYFLQRLRGKIIEKKLKGLIPKQKIYGKFDGKIKQK